MGERFGCLERFGSRRAKDAADRTQLAEKFDVVAKANLNQIDDPTDKQALLEYPCWAAPALSHGLLYIRGNDRLICMELIPQ